MATAIDGNLLWTYMYLFKMTMVEVAALHCNLKVHGIMSAALDANIAHAPHISYSLYNLK